MTMRKIKYWWPTTLIILALFLLGILALFNYPKYQNFASFGLIVITAIYMYATFLMVQEMRQTRLESVQPSLSLWPENYTLGGGFSSLYLRNAGGVAKNLDINIETISPDEKEMLYIPAIDKEHIVLLPVQYNIQKIMVNLTFDDSYNRKLNAYLEIDFSRLQSQNRKLAFQHDPLLSNLEDLKSELSRIERELGDIKNIIKSSSRR